MTGEDKHLPETTALLEANPSKQQEASVDEIQLSSLEGKEVRNTIVLGFSFFLAYSAFGSLQRLQSSLNDEDNLGTISMSAVYAAFILFGILSPPIIHLIGVKPTFILGWISHTLYTVANFYPDYTTLITASVIIGGTSGLIWTGMSTYITACSYSLSKHTNLDSYSALSKLLGLFFSLSELSGLCGNLVSSLVFQRDSYNQTESGQCGASYCPMDANVTAIDRPDDELVYILLGVYLTFDVAALVITAVFLSPLPKSTWASTTTFKSSLVSFFHTIWNTNVKFLVPFMLFLAFDAAFLTADYPLAYISCPIDIYMVGYVFAAYGALVALFNFLVSRIAQFLGRYVLIGVSALMEVGLCVFLYYWNPTDDDTILIFTIPMIWAIPAVIWLSQTQVIIGVMFPDQKEPAFANYHAWKSVGLTLAFALSSVMCIGSKLLMLMITLGVAMVFYVGVEIQFRIQGGHR